MSASILHPLHVFLGQQAAILHMQRMPDSMYCIHRATLMTDQHFLHVQGMPGSPPDFLQHVQRHFLLAGWQLRVLNKLQPAAGAFVDQLQSIAVAEAKEAALAVASASGEFVTSAQSMHCFRSQHELPLLLNFTSTVLLVSLPVLLHPPATLPCSCCYPPPLPLGLP